MEQISIPIAYKEFKYLNSHNINYDVQIAISRLEFPSDISITSSWIPSEIYFTAHILSNQMSLHDVSMSTHFGVIDTFHNAFVWDIVLYFPVKFRDLSANSMVVFTAWGPDGKPFGGTSMKLFDEQDSLKRGKQKLIFYFDRRGDNHIHSETLGELYESYSKYDDNFIKEKKLEQYKNSVVSSSNRSSSLQGANMDLLLDWLDRLVLAQIQSSIAVGRPHSNSIDDNNLLKKNVRGDSSENNGLSSLIEPPPILSPEIQDLYSYCCLVIDLPMFPYPVLFEEKLYPPVAPHLPHIAAKILSVGDGSGRTTKNDDSRGPIYEFNLAGKPFSGQALRQIVDWDMEADNPCENMYRRLAHDTIRGRGGADVNAKPNLKEKERLEFILNTPGDHLKPEDKDLMYRFRYFLTDNKMALSKFLLSIDWSSESEIAELPTLLALWKRKAPFDVSEALKLLSGGKAFQSPIVRSYAVDVLRNASDQELQVLLLQLVQALRYEPIMTPPPQSQQSQSQTQSQSNEDENTTLSPNTVDTFETETETPVEDGDDDSDKQQQQQQPSRTTSTTPSLVPLSPLGRFLVSRACTSTILANYFYWFLKVEIEENNTTSMFLNVFNVFLHELKTSGEAGKLMEKKLRALNEYIDTISRCQRAARDHKGRKDQKEVEMRKLLSNEETRKLPYNLDSVPLPLDPSFSATGLDPSTIFLFKSAMYPAVIDISVKPENILLNDPLKNQSPSSLLSTSTTITDENKNGVHDSIIAENSEQNGQDIDRNTLESQPSKHVYKIIFKSGDDLRQDQLIMQLISLMDGLLKKVNLDLGLLTYGILATGPTDGIMEFVRGSLPVSAVVADYGRNSYALLNYLREKNPDPRGPLGMKAQTLDMFVRSCASSCVVTYILGIGDRHLDNIMIRTNGQLFHIDFGFIFGRDPKPLPPPFRFTRHMADAMGGEDSEHYKKFQSYCCQAYNWLRKSANLILNLLSLMIDASIPDLSVRQDPVTVLKKVEEKFRLDLTDELAESFFLGLINDSLTALAPRLMEIAHQISVARR